MKWCLSLALLCVVVLFGCGKSGPEKFPVTGTVTYQGKPLPVGSVMFVPNEKGLTAEVSAIDGDGRYQLEAAPGQYLVQVQMAARLRGTPAPTGEGAQVNLPEVDWLIPEKYSHFQTSGLKATVKPEPENRIDLTLE